MAISFSTPFTFTTATTISSSDMNQNFSYIKNKFDGVEALTTTWSNLAVDTVLRSAGTIQSADGAIGAPGITFTGDLDNGLYRIGANNIALSAGNTKVIDMKTTGVAVLGTTTNDSAAAGYMGEYIESVISTATNSPNTGQYGDLTSISLTAGDWDVSAQGSANTNAAAAVTELDIGISTTSGNSATGLVEGDSLSIISGTVGASNTLGLAVPRVRMSVAITTVVYLKYRSAYAGSNPQYRGSIKARRVR